MARGTTRTTVRTTTVEGSDGKATEVENTSPLFAPEDIKSGDPVQKITVARVVPNEGHLDTIEASATEDDIRERWGGGTFQLRAYANGKIAKHREIKIAGDPVLVGKVAQADFYRKRGIPNPDGPAAGQQLDLPALLTFFREQGKEGRASEVESMERRRRIDAEAEERRRRWETELEEKRRKDEQDREERRRRDDDERERRRREDDERRSREAREFNLQMQQLQQANQAQAMAVMQKQMDQTLGFIAAQNKANNAAAGSTDPTEAILKGVNLVQTIKDSVGAGEGKDLLSTVVENLPDIFGQAAQAAKGVMGEVRGNPGAQAKAAGKPGQQLPADQEAEMIAKRLLSEGRDPAEWFSRYGQQLHAMKQQAAIAQQQGDGQKAVAAQPPQDAAQPAQAAPATQAPITVKMPPPRAPQAASEKKGE